MRAALGVIVSGIVAGVVALSGCTPKVPVYPYEKEPDPRAKELVLGVGDVVAINVWENKEFYTEATIRPDGTITMPLIGDLKAAGNTPTALKKQVKDALRDYVKPTAGTELVTVAVKSWRSYKFTVQGEVSRQGVFSAEGFVTVADAIAMAGGLSRFAQHSGIKIFRTDPATRQIRTIPISYDLITSGKRLDMNIWILAGDVITVP